MRIFTLASGISTLLKTRCTLCSIYRPYATRKRFYKGTAVIQNDNKWEVTLDHRRLKTPNGNVLTVGNEPLARVVAVEWDSQNETISQATMHLTALCNTALDNPGKLTSHDIVNYLLEHYPTDTLLFYSEDEEELRDLQERKWTPILDWFQKTFNVKQELANSIQPPPVFTETRAVLARHFLSYDFAALTAINFGVEALKSPILMLACMERRVVPEEAVLLARLEEEYQLERWGRVPWAHGLSQADLTARVSAALLLVHCATEKHAIKTKSAQDSQ
ncbi:ATP synthase mitochondrial F1 complex assembly factor 2 isoform X1 [Bombyx mori]|uniref:ATP synthase mitochondrial F1 complex assembly factor 2 n=1 Tax=Bombyx mori TaxID=7091 RepID=A0A8R2AP59_BOMMO|nr:ATP synthase mitochondrial F1 complex assembly factor 2 [Bombyx mori]